MGRTALVGEDGHGPGIAGAPDRGDRGFLCSRPSTEEIAAFRLSDATVERVRNLLAKNAAGTLSREESEELDQLVLLDRIVMLIRSRLPHPGAPQETARAGVSASPRLSGAR